MNEELFLNTVERPTAVGLVVDKIKELLIQQKLKPGDLIPSEQILAEKVGVSRGSVREAMKILSAFGVVEIRRGSGTYISNASNRKLFDSLLFQLLVQPRDYTNLIEIRSMMELYIVRLIVEKASDDELHQLNTILEHFEESLSNPYATDGQTNALDLTYHRMMGACCHNPLLDNMYHFIVDLFTPTINSRTSGTAEIHRNLQDALNNRDLDKALEVMMEHNAIWSNKVKS